MKTFIIFIVVLAIILIAASKIINPMMGIFIVSIAVSMFLKLLEKEEKNHTTPEK